VVALSALLLALAFGAGDQYLGSMSWHPWAADVSLLSAPWLVLAFAAGATQRSRRAAALLGFGCTVSALAGYGLMTLSPVENAQLSLVSATAFLSSERLVFAGAVLTGPLFGLVGRAWRCRRSLAAGLVTAALACLEPLAHSGAGEAIRFRTVSLGEVAAGLAFAAFFTGSVWSTRHAQQA
jgi:hypothetical protein